MGNCQAIDAAAIVIEEPCGRVEKLYWNVRAGEVMKTRPGHYVALLIATTHGTSHDRPVRVTRVKLLRPADTLLLDHVYRLITAQDVMKGLEARKQTRMRKVMSETIESDTKSLTSTSEMGKQNHHQGSRHEKQRALSDKSGATATARARTWQPSLHSISEFAS